MKTSKTGCSFDPIILGLLLFLCGLSAFSPPVVSQPACQSAEFIERVNKGQLQKTAHIKGDNAILFIALDPVFSSPEFDYGDHYRDEHFIEAIKSSRESLFSAGIDEVIVWRLPFKTMGVAVGFKAGCAVDGYGEPDYHEKLMLMHEAFLQISKHNLEAPSVRSSIKKLILGTRYSRMYKEEMVDIVINNLRPLVADPTLQPQ
jgi:hypothetical protein